MLETEISERCDICFHMYFKFKIFSVDIYFESAEFENKCF